MFPEAVLDLIRRLGEESGRNLLYYCGQVARAGYEQLCAVIPQKRAPSVALILSTNGGDPDAGFRIARALQHHYERVEVWISGYCKSAGTLICLGAHGLVMADTAELGPLDVQIRKQDELFAYGSGLDVIRSLGHLQTQAMTTFRAYVLELQSGAGMTTKTAAEFATKLATGLYSPIYSQIDPVKLGELQRSLNIANGYGEILSKKSQNLKEGAINALVANYPSHSFVIDRAMAREHFAHVVCPDENQKKLLEWLNSLGHNVDGHPIVADLEKLARDESDGQPASECKDGSKDAERSGGDDNQPELPDERGADQEHPGSGGDGAGAD